ncbi:hydrogenase maturation protease family protein [Mycobacterium kansasii 732]|uniref:Hydrogenase 2 maturation protease n=1 Tax=Mycobacterium pseudokansasii TaxID=2341080 RepID=A0A498QRB4_9MYCO|nr:hydrogenase maturation protease [Mycobacterium pseudokansasii]EUA10817.1 hydrogenase maturation protease family protein [Mycobacterium kansasii 732]MBY0386717.1 hydrogenase maturation protease [Mycobacterium pseudokansasii]VAZ97655.1 hypothetical protein LAUMK35_03764 [Mycobacterium pseudokansasii]VAZ99111.1 hypothetical protein LAUMK21_03761 [Mycobacterium pseudokansasii]VBA52654.1 hypothetical protein LAUMK142_03651 [Mycobacterium pseudokansasii]
MTAGPVVVIGLGNRYRRDDGVGIVAAAALDELGLPDIRVVTDIVEPMGLVEAWSGARLAVVIDAAVSFPSTPGRVTRCALGDLVTATDGVSSHRVDVAAAYALGQALARVPDRLEVVSVEAADTGHGVGLTPQVAAAVPAAVSMAVDLAAEVVPVAARRDRDWSHQGYE